jgi:hypothetical protein
MLPLLIILFLISYGLLTMLVVQQGKAIDSQRSLIHLLFKDNVHLSALKGGGKNRVGYAGQNMDRQVRPPQGQTPSSQIPLIQAPSIDVPSVQIPSNQVPSNQAPSSRTKPQANAKTAPKSRKAEKQLPMRPPVEVTDPSDMRRVKFSI